MKLGWVLEKVGHEHFNDFNCLQMCFHDISKIEPSRMQEWSKAHWRAITMWFLQQIPIKM